MAAEYFDFFDDINDDIILNDEGIVKQWTVPELINHIKSRFSQTILISLESTASRNKMTHDIIVRTASRLYKLFESYCIEHTELIAINDFFRKDNLEVREIDNFKYLTRKGRYVQYNYNYICIYVNYPKFTHRSSFYFIMTMLKIIWRHHNIMYKIILFKKPVIDIDDWFNIGENISFQYLDWQWNGCFNKMCYDYRHRIDWLNQILKWFFGDGIKHIIETRARNSQDLITGKSLKQE